MARFNTPRTPARTTSPVRTEATASAVTHESGPGFARDAKSELFVTAVSTLLENTFYESADERAARISALTSMIAVTDPAWMTNFVTWLRGVANLRSVSVFIAATAAKARTDAGLHGDTRQIVAGAIRRADEPGEMLAAWRAIDGGMPPKPVKRGIADGALATYTERSFLKYRGRGKTGDYSMADVLNVVHPKPGDGRRSNLFSVILADQYGADYSVDGLPLIAARQAFAALPVADRLAAITGPNGADVIRDAGLTWESLTGLIGGKLPALAWEALIPNMGVMALTMNLRNMGEAGISRQAIRLIEDRFADAEQVRGSRMLPMQLLSAYRNTPLTFHPGLEQAIQLSLANVPALPGRTLILVDTSGSMSWARTSGKSQLTFMDAAAMFGSALALRAENADLVQFGTGSERVRFSKRDAILQVVGQFRNMGGTKTAEAVRQHYAGHDRVVIVTDEQNASDNPLALIPANVPVYTWNLAGYQHGHGPSGSGNRHTFGGLNDAMFALIPLIERGRDADWPWED